MNTSRSMLLLLLLLFTVSANAVVFGVDSVSTGAAGTAVETASGASDPQLQNNAYFNDHMSSGNTLEASGSAIGVSSSQNISGFSKGTDVVQNATMVGFSVSTGTVGSVGGAVNNEVLGDGAAADLFVLEQSASSPFKQLDATDLGLLGSDNIDAIDVFDPIDPQLTRLSTELYFTVDSSVGGITTGNIYLSDLAGNVTLFKSAASMGLTTGDVIDGLVLDAANDLAMFSLASGSTSLGANSGADIFMTDFTGSFALTISHLDLGLLSTDEVDALETNASVALPAQGALFGLGLVFLAGSLTLRRNRSAWADRRIS